MKRYRTDVSKVDMVYRWSYIIRGFNKSYVHRSLQKFMSLVRSGVHQSDWTLSIWGSNIIRTGPPLL